MFDEKRSWITKYPAFSVLLLMIRYNWMKNVSVKQTENGYPIKRIVEILRKS